MSFSLSKASLPFFIIVSPLYCSRSICVSLSLSAKNETLFISFPIILTNASKASSYVNPSTPLSERKMTGYFPMYSSHSSLLPEIYKPSNKALSVPISKKLLSMLILRVFPKRRGRVKSVTSLQFNKSCSISLVLST